MPGASGIQDADSSLKSFLESSFSLRGGLLCERTHQVQAKVSAEIGSRPLLELIDFLLELCDPCELDFELPFQVPDLDCVLFMKTGALVEQCDHAIDFPLRGISTNFPESRDTLPPLSCCRHILRLPERWSGRQRIRFSISFVIRRDKSQCTAWATCQFSVTYEVLSQSTTVILLHFCVLPLVPERRSSGCSPEAFAVAIPGNREPGDVVIEAGQLDEGVVLVVRPAVCDAQYFLRSRGEAVTKAVPLTELQKESARERTTDRE